jgi:hypothetical protein
MLTPSKPVNPLWDYSPNTSQINEQENTCNQWLNKDLYKKSIIFSVIILKAFLFLISTVVISLIAFKIFHKNFKKLEPQLQLYLITSLIAVISLASIFYPHCFQQL